MSKKELSNVTPALYATVLQKTNQVTDKIRIIGLVEEDTFKYTKIKEDLMSTEFPTIWLKIIKTNNKKFACVWVLSRMDQK